MSIADKYAELERVIRDRIVPPEPAIVPLSFQVEEEFELAAKQRKRYRGLTKKEKDHDNR